MTGASSSRLCPLSMQIGRATDPQADPIFRAHLRGCSSCRAEWEAIARVADLARALPYPEPAAERVARTRAALLYEARRTRTRPRWVKVVAYGAATLGAASVLAAVGLHAWHREAPPPVQQPPRHHAASTATSNDVPSLVTAPPPNGTTPPRSIRTPHARAGARAAVERLPSAKLATHPAPNVLGMNGASVGPDTTVVPDTSVVHLPEAASSPPPSARAPNPSQPVSAPVDRPPNAAPSGPSPAELAFAEGWEAIRAGNYARAARSLERATALASASSEVVTLEEDARYWRAVALVRAGRGVTGRAALADFLERHPASPRAGQASVMLGWLLAEDHDCAGAEARFRAAEGDSADAVREKARAGLAELARCQSATTSR